MDPELPKRYHGADASFVQPVLEQFDAQEVRNFFGRLGLLTIEKNGYVYPYTNQASSVLEVLLAELRRWKVKLKLMEKVEAITCEDRIWKVRTGTWTYEAERLILSCGSKCAPTTGSDGSGYRLAKIAGLKLIPVVPRAGSAALREAPALAAGVRSMAEVSLAITPKKKQDETWQTDDWTFVLRLLRGEVQWTKYGISGIAVFQLSRYVAAEKGAMTFQVTLDLLKPCLEEQKMERAVLQEMLWRRAGQLPSEPVGMLLRGILNEKLIPLMLDQAGIRSKLQYRSSQKKALHASGCMQKLCTAVDGTKSFDICQVCAGGVDALHRFLPDNGMQMHSRSV